MYIRKQLYMDELTKAQFELLTKTTVSGNLCFAQIQPLPEDEEKTKQLIAEDIASIEKLVEWGLVEKITDKFGDTVELFKQNNKGRLIDIYKLSVNGYAMFNPAFQKEGVH